MAVRERMRLFLLGGLCLVLAACGSSREEPVEIGDVGPADDEWGVHIYNASQRFDVPELWIRAVMHVESRGRQFMNGRPTTSPAGAQGLMQVMPATYNELRARYDLGYDAYNPEDNILAGTAYIREMYEQFGSPGFLAAYNAGPGRYQRVLDGRQGMPEETRNYINMIGPYVVQADPRVRVREDIELEGSPQRAQMLQLAERAPAPDFLPESRRTAAPLQTASEPATVVDQGELDRARARADAQIAANTAAVDRQREAALARLNAENSITPIQTAPTGSSTATGIPTAPPVAEVTQTATAPTQVIPSSPTTAVAAQQPAVIQQVPTSTPSAAQAAATVPPSVTQATASPAQSAAVVGVSPAGSWGVQVGAFSTEQQVLVALDEAQAAAPFLLSTAQRQSMAVSTGNGTLYRARLAGLDADQAFAACQALRRSGQDCVRVSPAS